MLLTKGKQWIVFVSYLGETRNYEFVVALMQVKGIWVVVGFVPPNEITGLGKDQSC